MQPMVPCTTLTAPWWRRRLWDAKIIGAKVLDGVLDGLKRRGIYLYTLDTEADTPPEEGSNPTSEGHGNGRWTALGESVHAIQVTDGRLEDRDDRLVGRAGGGRDRRGHLLRTSNNGLGEEAGGAVGHLLPIPQDGGDGSTDDPNAQLKLDLAAGHGEGRMSAPQQDWVSSRFGADPPLSLGSLRGDAAKLAPVRFDFSGLWAHDLAGRGAAFAKMVQGGMELERAAALEVAGVGHQHQPVVVPVQRCGRSR